MTILQRTNAAANLMQKREKTVAGTNLYWITTRVRRRLVLYMIQNYIKYKVYLYFNNKEEVTPGLLKEKD